MVMFYFLNRVVDTHGFFFFNIIMSHFHPLEGCLSGFLLNVLFFLTIWNIWWQKHSFAIFVLPSPSLGLSLPQGNRVLQTPVPMKIDGHPLGSRRGCTSLLFQCFSSPLHIPTCSHTFTEGNTQGWYHQNVTISYLRTLGSMWLFSPLYIF